MQRSTPLKAAAAVALTLALTTGCATSKQMKATQAQLDEMSAQLTLLVDNTRRDTLTQIFGDQSEVIVAMLDQMDEGDKAQFETLLCEYQQGASTLDEVRTGMVTMLGGGERVVASARGIWVRDAGGTKLKAISRGTEMQACRKLEASEIPQAIAENPHLTPYAWGAGQLDGVEVIFPWELTMSTFTKEIVENTARRTAEEFMRMSGDGALNRPIQIQVTTDPSGDGLKISYPTEDGEIYITDGSGKKVQPEPKPAPKPQ